MQRWKVLNSEEDVEHTRPVVKPNYYILQLEAADL